MNIKSITSTCYTYTEQLKQYSLSQSLSYLNANFNPFSHTASYVANKKGLEFKIRRLKSLKKNIQNKINTSSGQTKAEFIQMKDRVDSQLKTFNQQLEYLKKEETANTLLKWATPLNYAIKGSGEVIQSIAYASKVTNAAKHYFKTKETNHLIEVSKEIAIAASLVLVTSVATAAA